jgi:hypothetical protein
VAERRTPLNADPLCGHIEDQLTSRELSEVLFAAAGIWYLAEAIATIPFVVATVASPVASGDPDAFLQTVAVASHLVTYLIIAGALLFGRSAIARWLFPRTGAMSSGTLDWQPAALAVVGAYFFVEGLAAAVPLLLSGGAEWQFGLSGIVEAALGIGLFLGAHGISNVWNRARNAGRKPGAA